MLERSPLKRLEKSRKAKIQKVFWGLGEEWWKQIIDGDVHRYGSMVFDKGLHGKNLEPGFKKSLQKACKFAASHFNEEITVADYKKIHKKACSHFTGDNRTATLVGKDKTGVFRSCSLYSSFHIVVLSREFHEIINKQSINTYKTDSRFIKVNNDLINEVNKKAVEIIDYLEGVTKTLGIPNVLKISLNPCAEEGCVNNAHFTYECPPAEQEEEIPNEIERIAEILFENYNQTIKLINLKLINEKKSKEKSKLIEAKVEAIAFLFQMLEWLHPFYDGQGRTDLILLSKLLSEQGLNPPILFQPYVSTFSSFKDWVKALHKGMELWRARKKQLGNLQPPLSYSLKRCKLLNKDKYSLRA